MHENGNWSGVVTVLEAADYVELRSQRLAAVGIVHGDSLACRVSMSRPSHPPIRFSTPTI
jgi:Fe2+ transport system protein FeoA